MTETLIEDVGEFLFDTLTDWLESDCGHGVPRSCGGSKAPWALRYIPEDEYVGDDNDVGAFIRSDQGVFHSGDLASFEAPESSRNCLVYYACRFTFGMKRCIQVVDTQGRAPRNDPAKRDAIALAQDKIAVGHALAELARRNDMVVLLDSPVEKIGGGGSYRTEVSFAVHVAAV